MIRMSGGIKIVYADARQGHHRGRRSIHNRPTCPFSMWNDALTEQGPRPVVYKINLRFRRSGQTPDNRLDCVLRAPRPKDARRGSSVSRAHDLA